MGIGASEFLILLALWLLLTGSALWRLGEVSGWGKVAWVALIFAFPLAGPVVCHLVRPWRGKLKSAA